ncbi:hypothetical protein [Paenibacillus sp. SN-8-1]|uniref:hypothetical protein n=1 Tax=Paenibacillus sp. SN-8-1 TaxID=3435409 RepID=UPI003D9A88D4
MKNLRWLPAILLIGLFLLSACGKQNPDSNSGSVSLDKTKLSQYTIVYIGTDQALLENLKMHGAKITRQTDTSNIDQSDIIIIDNDMIASINTSDIKKVAALKGKYVFFDRANNTKMIDQIFFNQKSYEQNREKNKNTLIYLKRGKDNQLLQSSSIYLVDEYKYERMLGVVLKLIDM